MRNLFQAIETASERFAENIALEHRPRFRTVRLRYRELAAHWRNVAAALAVANVGPGDRVVLGGASSPYWVAGYFGVLGRGAVVVPINPQCTPGELDRITAIAEPRAALVAPPLAWPASAVPGIDLESAARRDGGPVALPGRDSDAGTLAEIVFTSGTTGDPKGVMLSHGNLLANVDMVGHAVPVTSGDRVLCLVPLFHVYAQMTSMLYPLSRGCAVTYLAAPSSRNVLDALRHGQPSHLVAVPEFLQTMMTRLEQALDSLPRALWRPAAPWIRARISPTLHTIVSGGAPLDAALERRWRALGYEILQGYGLTETSPVIASNTPRAHRLGSVGKPCVGVQVRIADDGEILVKGPNVMAGYYKADVRTREVFVGDWLKTDDGGHLDADGFLHVHGRRKYMILGPGGENVFPEDVEAELNKLPGVKDSAVFGLERAGRTLVHAVVLAEGCDPAALMAAANRELAPHQRIASCALWPARDFPRSATRKAKKTEIIAWARGSAPPPPTGGTTTPLTALLARVTHHEPGLIGPHTLIVPELGVDSLMRIELASCLEEELGLVIDETCITPETTVAELEARINDQAAPRPAMARYPRWSLSRPARFLRPIARGVLIGPWMWSLCRLRVAGVEHLRALQAPVLFMANHRSYLDSPAIVAALPRHFKRSLAIAAATDVLYRRYRRLAPLADLLFNSYPLPTGATEEIRPALDYTGRLLDHGWSVLIYPEGQLNRTTAPLLSLKGGAGMFGVEMQVPIVPVAVRGTAAVLPPGRRVPRRRGTIDVRFGAALRVAGDESQTRATQMIEHALRSLLDDWPPGGTSLIDARRP